MIEKLDINSKYLDDLEQEFSVFTKDRVINDIENNTFTNYYVYVVSNKAIAFINYQVMYERSELIDINVADNFRNQKIATKLLEFMFNDLSNKKVESITLEVRNNND